MILARQQYNNYRGNLVPAQTGNSMRPPARPEENIHKKPANGFWPEILDDQTKGLFGGQYYGRKEGSAKRALDTLRKNHQRVPPEKAQTFIRLQEQRYDQLIQSRPAKRLASGANPCTELGEKKSKTLEETNRQRGQRTNCNSAILSSDAKSFCFHGQMI